MWLRLKSQTTTTLSKASTIAQCARQPRHRRQSGAFIIFRIKLKKCCLSVSPPNYGGLGTLPNYLWSVAWGNRGLTGCSWNFGTCIPSIMGPKSSVARHHPNIEHLELFTDVYCSPSEPEGCLTDLSAFHCLTSLCWIGPKATDLPGLYAAIEANEPHLQELRLDFVCMFYMHNLIKAAPHQITAPSVMDVFTSWMLRLARQTAKVERKPLWALKSLKLANIPLSEKAGQIVQHLDLRSLVLRECDRWEHFCSGVLEGQPRPYPRLTQLEIQQSEISSELPYETILARFINGVGRLRDLYLWLPYHWDFAPEIWTSVRGHKLTLENCVMHCRCRKAHFGGTVDAFVSDQWMDEIEANPGLNPLGSCCLRSFGAPLQPAKMVLRSVPLREIFYANQFQLENYASTCSFFRDPGAGSSAALGQ